MNQAASDGVMAPVVLPDRYAAVTSGSTWSEVERFVRIPDHPDLKVPALSRLVASEFQAMVGTMASTRQSVAAVTNWIPPP